MDDDWGYPQVWKPPNYGIRSENIWKKDEKGMYGFFWCACNFVCYNFPGIDHEFTNI